MLFKIIPFLFLMGCLQPKYPPKDELNPRVDLKTCEYKFQETPNCISLNWEVRPSEEDFGQFVFKVYPPNESGETEEIDGDVSVFLWMPSMGHGSSPVTVERIDVGTYRALDVFFSMPGSWEMHIQVKKNNEIKDQAIIPFIF